MEFQNGHTSLIDTSKTDQAIAINFEISFRVNTGQKLDKLQSTDDISMLFSQLCYWANLSDPQFLDVDVHACE